MNVLIVPSWYPTIKSPNTGVFFKEQALALQNYGLNVTVMYPEIWSLRSIKQGHKGNIGLIITNEDGLQTYRIRGYNYFPRFKPAIKTIYYRRLKQMINKYIKEYGAPDLLHAHSIFWGGWAAAKISEEYKIPLVITEHSTAYERNLIREDQVKYINYALSVAKKLVVVGPGLERSMQKYTSKGKIKIIPNIVDMSKFKQNSSILTNNKFRFFSLGFLKHKKGLDLLIKAFSKSFKGYDNVELVIGGDGEERENLENLSVNEGIQDKVKFLGDLTRDRVVEEMQKCDVFVLPSRFETFGVVYIEALACGKPIIATRCGGPEMIVNKNNGLLCDVNNIEELKDSLIYLYENIDNYDPDKIIEDCKNRFSAAAVSKQLFKLYEDTIKL